METETNEETVEVRFITRLEQYKVTETPFRLPIGLARYGLSGVINHLLSLDPPKPFDFLISNEFLRTSIEQYLKEKKLTTETTLEIEYVEALNAPEPSNESIHDDWISSVDCVEDSPYLVGCYDGSVKLVTQTGDTITSSKQHKKAIKDVKYITKNSFVTCGQDKIIKVWNIDGENDKRTLKNTITCKGHNDTINTLSVIPDNDDTTKFVSGSLDKTVIVWNTLNAINVDNDTIKSDIKSHLKKRRVDNNKIDNNNNKELVPSYTLNGHTQGVTVVKWINKNEIISGSYDNTIRCWDTNTMENKQTMTGNKVIISMDYNKKNELIATGHEDNGIRIWDLRTDAKVVTKQLKSHSGWVSNVSWHPTIDHLLLTSSYDKTIKLWDIRSSIPLFTLTGHTDKVLTIKWVNPSKFVSGSADTKLLSWQFKTLIK